MVTKFITGNRNLCNAFFIAALAFFGACDNSFDPVNSDNNTYSVHGMLDLLEETSYIRVKDLNTPFTLEATEELNALVTLLNLDLGESTQLSSTIREYRGVYLHTFHYDEKVFPDTRYLLRVENSSGIQVELDISLSRDFEFGTNTKLETQAGVINVYDRRNIFNFDYNTLQRVDQSPFLPYLSLRLVI